MTYDAVLTFWFHELTPDNWWQKNPELDKQITKRFLPIHSKAAQGELVAWRNTAHGALAEIIILDQFSRNIYRGKPESFAFDAMALVLAQFARQHRLDMQLDNDERAFLYMPFMHSESRLIHKTAKKLFSQPGLEQNHEFELQHAAIIERFGRYPHRNAILGRQSTEEEARFLTEPGSSF